MLREDDRVFFTEQDKKNIIIKKYTSDELHTNELIFKKKRTSRRIAFLVILLIEIVLAVFVESMRYPLYIALIFWIFVIVLFEYIDRINMKAVRRRYYIELIVREKLEIENYLQQILRPGINVIRFYPIRGRVVGSEYESVFYVEQKQYDAEIGEKIRITVKASDGKYL